ncbi:MAG: hypothetical protein RL662_506 [Bacteroidota bacterium]|jgi:hypothetical protein
MMKKYIAYSLILGASLLNFSSCSLDEIPYDEINEEEAYKSDKLIYLSGVAGLYNDIGGNGWHQGLAGSDRGLYDLNIITGDEAIIPTRGADWYDGGQWLQLYQHEWTTSDGIVKGTWDYLYKVVGKTNTSLDKMGEFYKADTTNIYLRQYIAEVRAIRAMYYYYLLDNYARVPIVTSSSTPLNEVRQSDRKDVYAFTIQELQEALPLLKSAKSAAPGSYYGRMTKSVAFFLLAKLALNAEVYSDNDWTDNGGLPNGSKDFTMNGQNIGAWKATIAYCDSITNEGYSLNPNFRANFAVKNEGSPENIFVIPMDPSVYSARNMYLVRTRNGAHGKALSNQDGWNGTALTLDLLNLYREDGGDPRLEMSFYTGKVKGADGNYVQLDGKDLEYIPDAIKAITTNEPTEKTAGARWAKYEEDLSALDAGKLVNNDFVLYRYADVVLMKAEAMVRDGQNADALLAQVRDRVKAPKKPATLINILKERAMELSWEGFRRQDLIRFGQFTKPAMDRPKSEPKRIVFPIPAEVILINSNLTQNPQY